MSHSDTPDGGTRASGHEVIPPDEMSRLAKLIEGAAGGAPVTASLMDSLAASHGVPLRSLYAAASSSPSVEFAREHKVAFVVCCGACQGAGALGCLDELLELRARRRKRWFKRAFDIQTKGCLNGCDHGPMLRVHTRDGVGYIQRAKAEDLAQAVEDICG